jgi:hypothetical protein
MSGADFNIKPAGAIVAAPVPARAPAADQKAVETLLPPSNAVVAADSSAAAQNDAQANYRRSDEIVIDRDAAAVVYRTVDAFTRVVVSQFPDEAILRSRAYGRALDIARQDQSHKGTTDRTI